MFFCCCCCYWHFGITCLLSKKKIYMHVARTVAVAWYKEKCNVSNMFVFKKKKKKTRTMQTDCSTIILMAKIERKKKKKGIQCHVLKLHLIDYFFFRISVFFLSFCQLFLHSFAQKNVSFVIAVVAILQIICLLSQLLFTTAVFAYLVATFIHPSIHPLIHSFIYLNSQSRQPCNPSDLLRSCYINKHQTHKKRKKKTYICNHAMPAIIFIYFFRCRNDISILLLARTRSLNAINS